jgi:tetratricopeptide (TPR) repeat protein
MDYPYNLGSYTRKVTATSADAQRWFDRGLNWCFGYHHEEAVACFAKALETDPNCAMAHWGVAYAVGPNYNFPWELQDPAGKAAALARAYDSAGAALALVGRVSAAERALIEALPARYPQRDPIDDQRPWNDAFADAMRLAHSAHPDDLDLRFIFAEAILNRTPWRMWDLRTGEPAPGAGTLEAREVLESAFRDRPGAMNHPGLLHLHVHLMEMSPHPEAALVTGDRLRELTPDMGHLVHMPTHIDVQCGHYRDAMHWNQKAIIADRKFYDRAGPMNFYSGYRVHNYHFAAYGAMFLGQYAPAIAAADELIETMPEEALRIPSPPMADFFESYVSIRQHVLIRFGKWRGIIAQDLPADRDLYCNTVAMMHYAKGVAHAALDDVPAAAAEQALFREAVKRVPKSRYLHNVPCGQLLAVAEEMLEGEIAYRRGDHDAAFARLRAARAGGQPALRRALGMDAAGPPRAWRAAAGAGPHGGSRGRLSRGSRPRRRTAPRPDPPGQFVGPARAAGLPQAARRDCGGSANPPARGLRRRARRSACGSVLLLRSRQGGLRRAAAAIKLAQRQLPGFALHSGL